MINPNEWREVLSASNVMSQILLIILSVSYIISSRERKEAGTMRKDRESQVMLRKCYQRLPSNHPCPRGLKV